MFDFLEPATSDKLAGSWGSLPAFLWRDQGSGGCREMWDWAGKSGWKVWKLVTLCLLLISYWSILFLLKSKYRSIHDKEKTYGCNIVEGVSQQEDNRVAGPNYRDRLTIWQMLSNSYLLVMLSYQVAHFARGRDLQTLKQSTGPVAIQSTGLCSHW